jgi:hypothetical protein
MMTLQTKHIIRNLLHKMISVQRLRNMKMSCHFQENQTIRKKAHACDCNYHFQRTEIVKVIYVVLPSGDPSNLPH